MIVTVALLTVAALSTIAATMLSVQKQTFPTVYVREQASLSSDLSDLCFQSGSHFLAVLSKTGQLPTNENFWYVSNSDPSTLRSLISSAPAGIWPTHSPNARRDVAGLNTAQRVLYENAGIVCGYRYLGAQYDRNTSGGVKGGEISVSRDYNASQGRERMFLIRAETVVPKSPPYASRVSIEFHVGVN